MLIVGTRLFQNIWFIFKGIISGAEGYMYNNLLYRCCMSLKKLKCVNKPFLHIWGTQIGVGDVHVLDPDPVGSGTIWPGRIRFRIPKNCTGSESESWSGSGPTTLNIYCKIKKNQLIYDSVFDVTMNEMILACVIVSL